MTFWHDPDSNTMVYDTPNTQHILPYFRGAKALHNGYLAVPADLYNCQVAQHLKLPTIPVVDQTYDWPIKSPWRPREHQKVMTEFMVQNPRCFNLSDMGTMKTLAALWAADYIMGKYPGTRCIVVAPLSILQRVWGDAITRNFLGRRTYTIVHGEAKRRRELLARQTDFYIINHDGVGVGAEIKKHKLTLGGLSHDIASRTDIQIVIIDEASAYRDGTTRRHRVARAVLADKPYFWPLTGTPTSNGPLDAHGLARLVNNARGESFNAYKNRVMFRVSNFTWVPRQGAHAEAYKLLQPSIRYEMRECTDVPPCTEQMRDVELSAEQKKLYTELKRDLTLQLEKGVVNAVNEAALRLKLIQISCGALYDSDHRVTRVDCSPRLAELRAVIEEAQRKVIIFTPLTSVVHLLYEELKEYSRAMINGEVPVKVRDEIFNKFQTEADPQLLIADPATMSHGLDLFAASVVCWYGATDRTELYLQANRRIDRPGQTVPTTIVQLAATPVEREIFRRAASNTSMQGAILDMVRQQ
jgi:SNF2 family DNA or RNA helicase